MRLPMEGEGKAARVVRDLAIPMIHRAFESGVNYIDSAVGYCNTDSQRVVGEALRTWEGGKIIVSTKNPYYGEDEKSWWNNLEDSLKRLGVDSIDIYNHHGINWKRYTESVEPRISKWMTRAKDEGLIRHICFSFHDTPEALVKLVDTGYADVVTLQYNLFTRELSHGIDYAHKNGMGVVAMGPVGGGRLGADSEVLSDLLPEISRIPELALRFVLSNPHVAVALSGMSTMQHVEENVAIASQPTALTEQERDIVERQMERLKKMADVYCTGCGYCMPCPEGIFISHIFNLYNFGRVYGLWDHARTQYKHIPSSGREGRDAQADACSLCGACEEKCPQNIPIREQLKQAHNALIAE